MPRTYDPNEWFADASFPKSGSDNSDAFWKQSPRQGPDGAYIKTTRKGVNVRAYAQGGTRQRGGSRPGLARFIPGKPGDAFYVVQQLDVLYTTGADVSQSSLSGRVVDLVAVSQGQVYVTQPGETIWVLADNTTGEDPPLNISGVMFSAQNIQKLWIVDGINYCVYSPVTGAVSLWTASAGSMPADSDNNTARLICTWRGRTVLSGLLLDPQNWFMSAVGDPTDFDYAPATPSETQAVAGNNSALGFIGEPVMTMIPVTDDVLLFGTSNAWWAMRGDPMAGGSIDLITTSVGAAWGLPWAKAADGTVYFFANRPGVFRMDPNSLSPPVKVSSAIDQFLVDMDTGNSHVRMAWDDRYALLHVFITPLDAPAATYHLAYETRLGAWWLDRFSNSDMDPLCCAVLDGNEPGDRVVVIGSWDGYVRIFSPTATDDDHFEIESEVWIGPFVTDNMDEILLKDLQAVLSEDSGDVTFAVHAGRSAEEAFNSTAVTDGVWVAGRNEDEAIRVAGHAIYVRLVSSNPWALEQIRSRVATTGMVRRRS